MNNENRKQIRRLENKIYSAQKESLGIKDINDLRRIRNEILSLQHNIDRLLDIPSEAVNYMPARPAPSAPSAQIFTATAATKSSTAIPATPTITR